MKTKIITEMRAEVIAKLGEQPEAWYVERLRENRGLKTEFGEKEAVLGL